MRYQVEHENELLAVPRKKLEKETARLSAQSDSCSLARAIACIGCKAIRNSRSYNFPTQVATEISLLWRVIYGRVYGAATWNDRREAFLLPPNSHILASYEICFGSPASRNEVRCMNNSPHLVQMANDIGNVFRPQPREEAMPGMADHMRNFWTRRMREAITAHVDDSQFGELPQQAAASSSAAGSLEGVAGR